MDLNRVKQILSSSADISVHYNGVSVWIEDVDDSSNMAIVTGRDTKDEPMPVPINELVEE
ncbi:H-type small acid-soluble spore protein [Bacillus sp. B15-48]|uniref:H-type small acid-soluble spore protein n=1 Tax=Bacillus sp. B15-48 TaxID=1548601 RepID=UPI0019401EF9|nr:H-type small acid-soluble spore protein [Bacillus sp. B15-48]MBM4763271.1 H-type small acid-soluble spore protein [Bacillus sp. B15-48]